VEVFIEGGFIIINLTERVFFIYKTESSLMAFLKMVFCRVII